MSTVTQSVVCSECQLDYVNDLKEPGGIQLYSGKFVCPKCTPNFLKEHNGHEQSFLVAAVCPVGYPFSLWVRYRRSVNDARSSDIESH